MEFWDRQRWVDTCHKGSKNAEDKECGPLERWRKDQHRKYGERLYNGTKENLQKYFRPKKWNHGHLPQLAGKLFQVVHDKSKVDELWVIGMGVQHRWIQDDPNFTIPLRFFSKRNNYLGEQDDKCVVTGTIVMATGNACKRTSQSWEGSEGNEPKFAEVLTTNGIGYICMNYLCLAKV